MVKSQPSSSSESIMPRKSIESLLAHPAQSPDLGGSLFAMFPRPLTAPTVKPETQAMRDQRYQKLVGTGHFEFLDKKKQRKAQLQQAQQLRTDLETRLAQTSLDDRTPDLDDGITTGSDSVPTPPSTSPVHRTDPASGSKWSQTRTQSISQPVAPLDGSTSQQARQWSRTSTSSQLRRNEPSQLRSYNPRSSRLPRSIHDYQTQTTRLRTLRIADSDSGFRRSLQEHIAQDDDEFIQSQMPPSAHMTRLKQQERRDYERQLKEDVEREKRRLQAIQWKSAQQARLVRRHPKQSFIRSLPESWEGRVARISAQDPNTVLTQTLGGSDIAVRDFHRLLGHGQWLNDEAVNTYIQWVADAGNQAATAAAHAAGQPASKVPKFIAHNSFFYQTITDPKKGPTSTERMMKRLKAPGVSLAEVDTVFIPVCKGSHWTLGAVRPVAKTIEYFDSMSSRGVPRDFDRLVRAWLGAQLGDQYQDDAWRTLDTPSVQQQNGYDCGVMVCTNAYCVTRGFDPGSYVHTAMTQQRKCIAAVLLNRGFHGDFAWEGDDL